MYQEALNKSGYNYNLSYKESHNDTQRSRRNRPRNILWYNPPFSKNVKTNVGKCFLSLIDQHFPKSNPLHKIFNRNTLKLSYSCMSNVKTIISNLVKIFTRSRRDLAAISARSRRDTGNLGGQKLAAISPRFSPRCGKSRRPKTRRDLAAILAEMAATYGNLARRDFPISPRSRPRSRRDHGEIREISAAKNSPRSRRDSRRDAGNLGGQKRAAISPRFSPRWQRHMEISAGKYAARPISLS